MALSEAEAELLAWHRAELNSTARDDDNFRRYYKLLQRLRHMGLALPPELRSWQVVANWCRKYAHAKDDRQQVKSFQLPDNPVADETLTSIMARSKFASQFSQFNIDRQVFGRGFLLCHQPGEGDLPRIVALPPRQTHVFVDVAADEITSAARIYQPRRGPGGDATETAGVLYLPGQTIRARVERGKWVEVDRTLTADVVPVAAFFNGCLTGETHGESALVDLIPLQDSVARALTNMQGTQESHGAPGKWGAGFSEADFIDPRTGKPITRFEAYMNSFMMLKNEAAKLGQFTAADLKNFETATRVYGIQASIVTGMPARLWGITTSNPASEGAAVVDEHEWVRDIESDNEQLAIPLGEIGRVAYWAATGTWLDSPPSVEFFNPATPTIAQREDALMKRRAAGVLPLEGYWDELGYSEPYKDRMRSYMRAEAALTADPTLSRLSDALVSARG